VVHKKKKTQVTFTYFFFSSETYSIKSPGVQFNVLHKLFKVEKRISRALLVLRIDKLFTARPVASAKSFSFGQHQFVSTYNWDFMQRPAVPYFS